MAKVRTESLLTLLSATRKLSPNSVDGRPRYKIESCSKSYTMSKKQTTIVFYIIQYVPGQNLPLLKNIRYSAIWKQNATLTLNEATAI